MLPLRCQWNPTGLSGSLALQKSRRRQPRQKKTSGDLWLNNFMYKPQWVHTRESKLDAKLPDVSEGIQSCRVVKIASREGQLEQRLDVMLLNDQQGSVPSVDVYRTLLKACAERKSLAQAKRVHAHLAKHGLESTKFLGEYVVSTLVKCGGLDDALQVFRRLPHRTVLSWTAVISGYTMCGQGQEALRMYDCMRNAGLKPKKQTFIALLKACGSIADLEEGKRMHAETLRYNCGADLFVRTCLVDMYGKCGSVVDAQTVFDESVERDVVAWNVMIAAYAQQRQAQKALQLFEDMCREGVSPGSRTFVSAIQACGVLAEEEECVELNGEYIKFRSLLKGRAIHADARRKGYEVDVYVGSTLISFYGKCGSIEEAWNVFDGLSDRNVVSWTAMLAAYAEQGQAENVLELFEQMQETGVSPDARTFVSALHACGLLAEKEDDLTVEGRSTKVSSLEKGKAMHADSCRRGFDSDLFVGNTIISMYGKCGSFVDAQNVFDRLCRRDVVSWNAILAAYAQQGQAGKALQLYEQMQEEGVSPDDHTYASAFQACGIFADEEEYMFVDSWYTKLKALAKGQALHVDAWEKGFDSNIFVGSSLINMYGRCGNIVRAQSIFNGLVSPDVISWNALLAAYVEQGEAGKALQLYEQMWQQCGSPNPWTFVIVLQACGVMAEKEDSVVDQNSIKVKSFEIGKALHASIRKKGFDADVFVGSTLISMYGKSGSILDAEEVFDGLLKRNVVSWNAMLAAYVERGQGEKALEVYDQMWEECMPDERTFSSAIQACTMLADLETRVSKSRQFSKVQSLHKGKGIHADVRRKGFDSDPFVCGNLISMYGRCGSILHAWEVFDGLSQHHVVAWNAMLSALIENGQPAKALQLYNQMKEEGIVRNERTFVSALHACGMLAQQEEDSVEQFTRVSYAVIGNEIHADAQRTGYDSDVFVGSALISMYGKSGSITDAQKTFDALSHKDVVVWSAMLAAYVEKGEAEIALQLYEQMQEEGVEPDAWTFASALQACGMLAEEEQEVFVDGQSTKVKSLEKGKAIHDEAQRKGFDSDGFVANTLISMYGKCGSIMDARKVFDCLSDHSVVAWTSMLGAYAEHGKIDKALQLYRLMQQEGPSPNEITTVCILLGSSKTGSLTILREIHQTVIPSINNLSPLLASALISAYGRCASIGEAQAVFLAQPEPDVVSWNALIAAYAHQGCCEESLECYEKMQRACMKPNGLTFLSLLSACSHAGLVDRGVVYFESMTKEHALTPEIEHYVSMVDLLGRAGFFTVVEDLLSTMPLQPSLSIWLCLLGACRMHGKVALGEQAFHKAVRIEPKHAAAYVLMLNIYADAGLLDRAEDVTKLRQEEGAWRKPAHSWIDHQREVHTFLVGDRKHPQHVQLYGLLRKANLILQKESSIYS